MASATGNGVIIVFSTAPISATVVSIGDMDFTRPRIADSNLASTKFEEYIPGDLVDHAEVEVSIVIDPELMDTDFNAASGTPIFVNGAADTCTITFANAAASTLVGTAFLTGWKIGAIENNTRVEGSFTFSWDGKTEPTWVD